METRRQKYAFETYKIVLSLLVLGIVGAFIESRFSASTEKREKDALKYETALNSFQSVSSDLAKLRATAYRLSVFGSAENIDQIYESYSDAYLEFVGNKVGFIHSMSKLGVGDEEDTESFKNLNVSSIEMDKCFTANFVESNTCDVVTAYSNFVDLSAGFEEKILKLLELEK